MAVPVMRPVAPAWDAVAPRLREVERSGWFSNFGPQEVQLRSRFAEMLGVAEDRVALASNATLAIAGCVAAAERKAWELPSFTFTASVAAVLGSGVDVRFADIDAGDWWAVPSSRSDDPALLAVAPFGSSPVGAIASRRSTPAVVDAAASLGALGAMDLRDLPDQSAVVFSLHATKVLGAGEGGLVVFGSPHAARRFLRWTNFGFVSSRNSERLGTNAKMSEIQAAYAHAVLDGWDQERAEWIAARDRVLRVGDEVGLTTFHASRQQITPYWIAVFPDAATTELVERVLEAHGVATRRWWSRGCHRMAAYADVPHGPLLVTEDVADRYLGLPLYRGLSEEDAERIQAALLDARDRADAW